MCLASGLGVDRLLRCGQCEERVVTKAETEEVRHEQPRMGKIPVEVVVQSEMVSRSAEIETALKSRNGKAFEAQNFQAGRRKLNETGRVCLTGHFISIK